MRPPKPPRRAGAGLAALLLLSFMAAFFGWVSAEPLWLALGHGDRGTAIVVRCTGKGVGQRCTGDFTALDGRFSVQRVALLGAAKGERHAGATVTAWMVSAESRSAYAGDRTSLHLRWAVGLLLVLACGFGIGLATGATRLAGRRARFGAFVASVGAPLMIAAGFLAATF